MSQPTPGMLEMQGDDLVTEPSCWAQTLVTLIFESSFLLKQTLGAEVMALVRFLPPIWEAWLPFPIPSIGPGLSQGPYRHVGKEQ